MTRFNPLRRRLLMSAAAAALVPAAWPLMADTPVRGGVLRYSTIGLDTADAHRHTGSIGVVQAYAETLTSIAPDGSVEPFLAETIDVSADGTEYVFTLREGVRFHNGETLTAEDVVANFVRVRDNITRGWLSSAMRLVETVEAVDDRTVRLQMTEPYAPLLNLLSELWILSPRSEGWDGQIVTPIGTGPFVFADWVPGVRLHAPRFDQYWQAGLPYLDAIDFNLREDIDTALALRAGDLHIASVSRDTLPELRADRNIEIRFMKDTSWHFLSFNNRSPRPPFDNVRVREAVAHALDRPGYMNFISGEDGVVTNQMVAPGNFYFDQAMHDADPHRARDLARARAILAEEGVNPADYRLRAVSWQEPWTQVSLQMVRELGFEIEHLALDDLGAMQRLNQYDWDLAPFSSGPRADIFMRFVRLMSDGPNPGLWGGVQDPDFDRMVTAAVQTADPEARRQHYLDAWQHALDNYFTVVMGHVQGVIANRSEVRGWDPGFTYSPNWASGGIAHTWLANA